MYLYENTFGCIRELSLFVLVKYVIEFVSMIVMLIIDNFFFSCVGDLAFPVIIDTDFSQLRYI